MKKKVFYQVSIILYVALALFLAIMGGAIYAVIYIFEKGFEVTEPYNWIELIAAIGGFTFMAYTFIRMARNKIVLSETEIFVPENWGNKYLKIQYETHISYAEIKNIYITSGDKNSLNQTSRWVFTPMPYIVFECENDKQKAINIFYYSKKQAIKIIDEAIRRAIATGNVFVTKTGAELLSDFLEHIKKKN